jgi:lysophospholipase L1-like esterase
MHKKDPLLYLGLFGLAAGLYYRVTIGALNWATGMLFLATVWVGLFGIAETAMRLFKVFQNTKVNMRLFLITTGILLIGVELFLRFGVDKYSNYVEKNGSKTYVSLYQAHGNNSSSWFHVQAKDQDLRYQKTEFTHFRKVNSLGLCEQEITVEKSPHEYRILALGDSYTEGVGTNYDSTWVKVLERSLSPHIQHKKVTAINAGISASDVYYEYVLLKERLLPFKPDLVIVAINNSDIQDVMIRGGMERFHLDGSVRASLRSPPWEIVYAISYIVRHIVHDLLGYNWLLLKDDQAIVMERQAVNLLRSAINAFASLAREQGFRLLIVFHPHENEVKYGRYGSSAFHNLVSELEGAQDRESIDLLTYYRLNQIITKENSANYYWRFDLHHNTKGYELMGQAIAHKILELQLLSFPDGR